MLFTSRDNYDTALPNTKAGAMFDRLDIPHLDLFEPLREEIALGKEPYIRSDGHLSEYGHAFVARELFAYLKEHGFLDSNLSRDTEYR